MSPSELIEAGERLYGEHWRKPLAAELGIDISTLRRWATAQTAIPRVVELAIKALAHSTSIRDRGTPSALQNGSTSGT